jgi:chemotaxis response regulator CheB
MPAEPLIGIICDHNSAVLAGRIKAAGYRVKRVMPENLVPGELPEVNAWVIDCGDNAEVAEAMSWIDARVLALSNRPEPSQLEGYHHWCNRILSTLDKWTADLWHAQPNPSPTSAGGYARVQGVWILAGSTGALPAVSEFFAALERIPPVAFVYAQHIHADQQNLLTTIGRANRKLVCTLALGRHWLNVGHVLIAPAACRLGFTRQGEVFSVRDSWDTRETPNISQLMMALSGLKPAAAGAIMLSGAGHDGREGLRALHARGTRIWAQDPATAAAPSMPRAAIDQNLASNIASPKELAAALLALYPA